jgi:hypothetical protein
MRISALIEQLQQVAKEHGDIQVTCTGAGPDSPHSMAIPAVYETTVEKLQVRTEAVYPSRRGGLDVRVRLWW